MAFWCLPIAYPDWIMKLTKRAIDAVKPDGLDHVHWDDELRGFGLRIKQSGLKSFLIQFRNVQGHSRRLTVAQYGRMTPEEARREARRLLSDVERGLDPAEQRLEEKNAITVGELCREYLAKAEAGLIIGRKGLPKKASTLEIDRGRIARHIVPLLGKKPLKDLTSADVKRFLEAVISGKTAATVKTKARGLARVTGGATAAVRAVGLLGGMLSYAKEHGYLEHNPARGIRKPSDNRLSFRLAPEGYRSLGAALEAAEGRGEHWQAITAVRLIALTGCRRSEILNLKWSEVDCANSCLRFGDTKTGASIRPLPKAAQAILAGIERRREFVFPGVTRDEKSYASVFPKSWRRIMGDAYSPHGLRHAYASAAHELGLSELTIKALLGHARLGVTGGYITTVDSLLLDAAEKVAHYVDSAMAVETSEVMRIVDATASEHAIPDTRIVEGGREWPFRYTPAEREAIARAARIENDPFFLAKVQDAAIAYQWMSPVDAGGVFFVSNKRRRNQLEEIKQLCGQAPTEQIQERLCELDIDTYRLLGRVSADEPRLLARAANRAIKAIPHSGADPARARYQFIEDLAHIYLDATGRSFGRTVHDGEQGRFTAFVRATLTPFIRPMSNPVMGCEADIRLVVEKLKTAPPNRKKPVAQST